MKRFVPLMAFAIFFMYLAVSAFQLPLAGSSGFDVTGFGRLPVSVAGRVQPLDSVARLALLQIRASAPASLDGFKLQPLRAETIDPDLWLLEVLAKPDTADTRRIFLIDDRELLAKLQLSGGTSYYAFTDLGPKAATIGMQVQRIGKLKTADRAQWENALVTLQSRLVLYERLKNSVQPNSLLQLQARNNPAGFDFAGELATFRVDLTRAIKISEERRQGGAQLLDAETGMRLRTFARLFQAVSQSGMVAVIPPGDHPGLRSHWRNLGTVIVDSARGQLPPLPVAFYAAMSSAFAQDKPAVFNSQVSRYRQWLASNGFASEIDQAGYEVYYNRFQPFVRAIAVYAVAAILLGVAWRTRSATVYPSAVMLVLLAFAVHTLGIAFTMKLAGPPSYLTLVAWGITLGALVAEQFWRRGVAIAVATATGLGALVGARVTAVGVVALVQNVLDIRLVLAIVATVVVLFVGREAGREGQAEDGERLVHPFTHALGDAGKFVL